MFYMCNSNIFCWRCTDGCQISKKHRQNQAIGRMKIYSIGGKLAFCLGKAKLYHRALRFYRGI
ncbi:hypothetical protein BH10ACI3_BH10ACI3_26890 [soil metagenome]